MDRALAPRNLRHNPAPVSPASYDWLSTLMLRLTRLTPHLVTGHRAIGRCRGQAPGNWCRCSTLYFAPGFKTLLIRHQPSCNEPLGYQSWQRFTRSVFIYGSEKIAFKKLINGLKSPLSDLLKAALATVSADFLRASQLVTVSAVVIFSVRMLDACPLAPGWLGVSAVEMRLRSCLCKPHSLSGAGRLMTGLVADSSKHSSSSGPICSTLQVCRQCSIIDASGKSSFGPFLPSMRGVCTCWFTPVELTFRALVSNLCNALSVCEISKKQFQHRDGHLIFPPWVLWLISASGNL